MTTLLLTAASSGVDADQQTYRSYKFEPTKLRYAHIAPSGTGVNSASVDFPSRTGTRVLVRVEEE